MGSTICGAIVAVENKAEIWKFTKAVLRVLIAVAIGFAARPILDEVMRTYPSHAKQIDAVGQFIYAVVVCWFLLLPSLKDYGVIIDKKNAEREP